MKERPILFSAPMVRAILSGKKTQTRRIVKPQPPAYIDELHGNDLRGRAPYRLEHDETGAVLGSGFQDDNDNLYKCPYGTSGDRLWVRESFTISQERHKPDDHAWMTYDADGECVEIDGSEIDMNRLKLGKRYPSIHMPRWASRITLEVVAVRVERLQEISEADARAEGCDGDCPIGSIPHHQAGPCSYHFAQLWESINGRESWSANPWVWVVEFKKLEATA